MRLGGIPILFIALAALAVPVLAQNPPAAADSTGNATQGPHPTIAVASLDHDLGRVKPGTPIEFHFEFKNEGDADLVIESVKASCGCTTTSFDTLVAPGQTGSILLTIKNTSTYKGRVSKGAAVITNDPDHKRFRLTLHADFSAE